MSGEASEDRTGAPRHLVSAADGELVNSDGAIALAWAASTAARPDINFGDALSPVIVSAMSRLPIVRRDFDYAGPRLAAVGTIAHAQRNGSVHIWGTGMDRRIDPARVAPQYVRPADTRFFVHATRGPCTRDVLRAEGLDAPEVYGDPVWFLPRIMPRRVEPTFELGVVLHLTELERYDAGAGPAPALKRYEAPSDKVRIISPITHPTLEALEAKIDEILSCRRIASTSLHGLVVAETYGVPCVWFAPTGNGPASVTLRDGDEVDHRMRDFYAGVGKTELPIFRADRSAAAPWDELIGWIDRAWTPCRYDPTDFFEAYPLPKAVSLSDVLWPPDREAIHAITL